jgi:DNA-binding NarL/FixJ family response regulator
MRIYLVDKNKNFRKGLKLFLEKHLNHEVVGESTSIKCFCKSTYPSANIILFEIKKTCIECVHTTCHNIINEKGLNIIALSQRKELVDIGTLKKFGFKGFVSKENLFKDLENAITTVASGNQFYPC